MKKVTTSDIAISVLDSLLPDLGKTASKIILGVLTVLATLIPFLVSKEVLTTIFVCLLYLFLVSLLLFAVAYTNQKKELEHYRSAYNELSSRVSCEIDELSIKVLKYVYDSGDGTDHFHIAYEFGISKTDAESIIGEFIELAFAEYYPKYPSLQSQKLKITGQGRRFLINNNKIEQDSRSNGL